MSWVNGHGFAFRSTSGFVTDGVNDTYVTTADLYPVTRAVAGDSVTFGWAFGIPPGAADDLDNTVDPRLAGCAANSTNARSFRVVLPRPGAYDLRFAVGLLNSSGLLTTPRSEVVVSDGDSGQTQLLHRGPNDPAVGSFYDAADQLLTAAAWPGSNATARVVFTDVSLPISFTFNAATSHTFYVAYLSLTPVATDFAQIFQHV